MSDIYELEKAVQRLRSVSDHCATGEEVASAVARALRKAERALAEAIKAEKAKATSAVDAALALGWLPIEQAPKDGTVIHAWHPEWDGPMFMWWLDAWSGSGSGWAEYPGYSVDPDDAPVLFHALNLLPLP